MKQNLIGVVFAMGFLIFAGQVRAGCDFYHSQFYATATAPPGRINEKMVDLDHLSPQQQKKLFEGMKKWGIYYNIPYTWEHLQDPKLLLSEIYSYGEPLDSYRLNALERVSPELMKVKTYETLRASALLYRYSRPSGDVQLSMLLTDKTFPIPNYTVASIYALNEDSRKLSVILDDLRYAISSKNKFPPVGLFDLIDALGKWDNPKVADALWDAFQNTPVEADQFHPKQEDFVLALAQQENMQKALPALRKLYFGSAKGSNTHAYAGAAIVKIDQANTDQIFNDLLAELTAKTDPTAIDNRQSVIYAFGMLHITQSIPALKAIIQSYLAAPNSVNSQNNQDIVVEAGVALGKMDVKDAHVLVASLLIQLAQQNVATSYQLPTTQALLALGGADSEKTVSQTMGKKWLQAERFKRHLKPIPDFLIPVLDPRSSQHDAQKK